MRRALTTIATLAFILMLLAGINGLLCRLPQLPNLAEMLPEGFASWVLPAGSAWYLIVDLLMVFLPLVALLVWRQERRVQAAGYVIRHEKGTITVTDQALRRLIRAACATIPGLTEHQVALRQTTGGLAVQLRVKIDQPASWPAVRDTLLERVPAEINRAVDSQIVTALDIVFSDFAADGATLARPAPALAAASAAASSAAPRDSAPERLTPPTPFKPRFDERAPGPADAPAGAVTEADEDRGADLFSQDIVAPAPVEPEAPSPADEAPAGDAETRPAEKDPIQDRNNPFNIL